MRTLKKNLRENRESKGMKVFTFDVMVGDRYEATLHYRYSPLFPFSDDDIKGFVESEIPTLKGRKWRIAF